jgi:hypothetical protein
MFTNIVHLAGVSQTVMCGCVNESLQVACDQRPDIPHLTYVILQGLLYLARMKLTGSIGLHGLEMEES